MPDKPDLIVISPEEKNLGVISNDGHIKFYFPHTDELFSLSVSSLKETLTDYMESGESITVSLNKS